MAKEKWIVRFGYLALIYPLLCLVTEYLPVGFWENLNDWLKGQESETYFKVVPAESGESHVELVLIIAVIMIVAPKIYAYYKNT